MQPHSAHDALVKFTFSKVAHAEGELRAVLPKSLVERIDWSTLELRPGSYVDDHLKERHSDLLYQVAIAGRSALVYLLFEHKSKPEELVPFALLRYMVRIWERWLADNPNAKALPAIVPLVLHHGESGWTRTTRFEELLDLDDETRAALGEHTVRLRFVLDDLAYEDDEAIRGRLMSAFARLVLWCLRNVREPDVILEQIGRWRDLIREARSAPDGAAALLALWRYILMTNPKYEPEAMIERLLAAVGEEAKDEMQTAGEKLIERGETRGQRQGRQQMLLKQLTVRFGALPVDIVARVEAADVDQLDHWAERVLTAPTLAAVLDA